MNAYDKGYQAFRSSVPITENPYTPENDYADWDSWSTGWIDAKNGVPAKTPLEDFADFILAGMDMPGNERKAKWPDYTAQEEAIYQRWATETKHGVNVAHSDAMVKSWNSALDYWFIIPTLRKLRY